MSRTNVEALFSNFGPAKEVEFQGKLGDVTVVKDLPVIFLPNVDRGTKLGYWPDMKNLFAPFEFCDVYFDTNDLIVGYRYSYDR